MIHLNHIRLILKISIIAKLHLKGKIVFKEETILIKTMDIKKQTIQSFLVKTPLGKYSRNSDLRYFVTCSKIQECTTWEWSMLTSMDPKENGDQELEFHVCFIGKS